MAAQETDRTLSPSSTVELAAQIKARPLPARNYQPLLGHHLAQALGEGGEGEYRIPPSL